MRKQLLVFCSMSSAMLVSCSKVDTSQMKEALMAQTSQVAYALKEYPEDPHIMVFLFDVDNDGVPEAFVTYKGDFYNGMGCIWNVYKYKDGKWRWTQWDVQAFTCDFYSLTEEGQKPKLVVVCVNMEERQVYHITSDKEGNLKKIPMPEYEISDDTDDGFPSTKPKAPNGKLERIQVETLCPKGFEKRK